jgi:glycosyltransferase involved in cell wall biosynthesis
VKKKLKIALLAPFEEKVPPTKYGGIELIVSYIADILSEKGHKVFLFASGDSKTKAELIPIFPKAIRTSPYAANLKTREALKVIGIGRLIEKLKKLDVDVIHDHIRWRFLPFAFLFPIPTITTLHGPLTSKHQKYIHNHFKKHPFVTVSNSQRKPLPNLNYIATVYNGIDVKNFEFNENPKDYFAFLGRMSPEKGPVLAIQAAKAAGMKLRMAAKVDAVDVEFFKKEVKPLIDNKQIGFLGEIGPKEKSNFLKNARGLIAPIQWEEPFGLYFIEAMACGTPAIAFKKGAAPEVINHGKSGFVVKTFDEMVKTIKNINIIKRKNCRKWVEKNFTAEKMVDKYEKLYYKILK